MKWTIPVPIDIKSKNRAELARGNRAAAGIYKRMRDSYAGTVYYAALCVEGVFGGPRMVLARVDLRGPQDALHFPRAVPFRRVTIVRLWGTGQRAYDDDGFIAGCAALRDACQRQRYHAGRFIDGAGIVWDDSAKWSAWSYEQRKSDDGRASALLIVEED